MADIASAGNEKLSTASSLSSPVAAAGQGFDNLSLDEWLTKFGRIYGKRHDKHTAEYMISRLVEEVAELVNPMETQDNTLIAPNLADVFSWICSLAYKLNIDLSTLAWQKYGKNAPRPAWSKSESLQASLADFAQPSTLREWQVFISKVYQNENTRLTPMQALVSMMKDVGDLAMMNRKRAPQEQLSSKVAAILAWTLAISELLKLDLAKIVNAKYDDHCPVCLQPTCDTDVCHPLANMFVSFGDGTTDEEKYAVLDGASKFGYKTLVNSSPSVQSTRDLSMSRELDQQERRSVHQSSCTSPWRKWKIIRVQTDIRNTIVLCDAVQRRCVDLRQSRKGGFRGLSDKDLCFRKDCRQSLHRRKPSKSTIRERAVRTECKEEDIVESLLNPEFRVWLHEQGRNAI